MADLEEDGQTEPRRGKMINTENSGAKPKFKDPLMNTADGESDEAEVLDVTYKPE